MVKDKVFIVEKYRKEINDRLLSVISYYLKENNTILSEKEIISSEIFTILRNVFLQNLDYAFLGRNMFSRVFGTPKENYEDIAYLIDNSINKLSFIENDLEVNLFENLKVLKVGYEKNAFANNIWNYYKEYIQEKNIFRIKEEDSIEEKIIKSLRIFSDLKMLSEYIFIDKIKSKHENKLSNKDFSLTEKQYLNGTIDIDIKHFAEKNHNDLKESVGNFHFNIAKKINLIDDDKEFKKKAVAFLKKKTLSNVESDTFFRNGHSLRKSQGTLFFERLYQLVKDNNFIISDLKESVFYIYEYNNALNVSFKKSLNTEIKFLQIRDKFNQGEIDLNKEITVLNKNDNSILLLKNELFLGIFNSYPINLSLDNYKQEINGDFIEITLPIKNLEGFDLNDLPELINLNVKDMSDIEDNLSVMVRNIKLKLAFNMQGEKDMMKSIRKKV